MVSARGRRQPAAAALLARSGGRGPARLRLWRHDHRAERRGNLQRQIRLRRAGARLHDDEVGASAPARHAARRARLSRGPARRRLPAYPRRVGRDAALALGPQHARLERAGIVVLCADAGARALARLRPLGHAHWRQSRRLWRVGRRLTAQRRPRARHDAPLTTHDAPLTTHDAPLTKHDACLTKRDVSVTKREPRWADRAARL
mmetsp:Transcript_849/g.1688  ORF Transcript_849/g.1688 Transcript_849/m.1688 type:complete len:204 (+) Transcript_849:759-1370(+)